LSIEEQEMRGIHALVGSVVGSLLLGSAAMAADPAPAAGANPATTIDPMQQMVCRRDKETGSLVKTKKTCHTRAQWAYIDDANQAFSRDMVDASRTKSGGN
jgi:predicted transglutaminase-like cysteine proteinase